MILFGIKGAKYINLEIIFFLPDTNIDQEPRDVTNYKLILFPITLASNLVH